MTALDADALREIERTRLRSLVDFNLDVADRLHADDYQLNWHTDCYEMRDGRWQAIWSQATAIIGD